MNTIDKELTIDEAYLSGIKRLELGAMPLEAPVSLSAGGRATQLSAYSIKQMERAQRRIERKRLANKHRSSGKKHWRVKAYKRKKLRESNWREKPYWCVVMGWGTYAIEKSEWDRTLGQCWKLYDSELLEVKRHSRCFVGSPPKWTICGTREVPHTVYTLDVIHKELGLVYSGADQLLYDLSTPKA